MKEMVQKDEVRLESNHETCDYTLPIWVGSRPVNM